MSNAMPPTNGNRFIADIATVIGKVRLKGRASNRA